MTSKIVIQGQVQGVGFRPFVYVTAQKHQITGTVSNNEEGVIVMATGTRETINGFYQELTQNPPRVAKIKGHRIEEVPAIFFDKFSIVPSQKGGKLNLQLTPDFALCDACRDELLEVKNRRYYYPFTTCTYCGPRWAITNTFPFERAHTNLHSFDMCPVCQEEYTNPLDRRFHSQTNSCPNCGIALSLSDANGIEISADPQGIFKKIAALIREGNIIAIKNTSGYLLCCDAQNAMAIQTLRDRKRRPKKPFAILYASLKQLQGEVSVNKAQEAELISSERPIVLISGTGFQGQLVFDALAPGLNQLGVMLPYSGLLELLMKEVQTPVVATSGNIHGSPILSNLEDAQISLAQVADYFLHHNLDITNAQDDSVVKFTPKFQQKIIYRRSRGYAPNYYGPIPFSAEKIMALGGHLKSTIAFYPNDFLYLSQYLGHLDHYEVFNRFTDTIATFIKLFEAKPEILMVDKHPAYLSTQYGKKLVQQWGVPFHEIQHHKAHFASVLGEHHLFDDNTPVLGVIWDGNGYGDDGHIWGGEFFRYQQKRMERIGHFDYYDWVAGDKMAKEPKLSLLSLACDGMDDLLESKFDSRTLNIYRTLLQKNSLKTSSVGRLFDAVASLLGICDTNTYEGEAAILMEQYVGSYQLSNCKAYDVISETATIPTFDIIRNIFAEFGRGVPREAIICNFLFTLANLIFQVAHRQGLKQIALSGGVFQNAILVDMIKEIGKDDYILYFNMNISPNDENIALGQFMYYVNLIKQ
ncbi:carbamoyltransferase HypF [Eudoraea sp.]|uniref:carbamoyltransferase HypF n=1 Tax=Eudoraea sp. TaxID=1979955 RepID=UPI003C790724